MSSRRVAVFFAALTWIGGQTSAPPVLVVDPAMIVFRYRKETGPEPGQRCVGVFTPAGAAFIRATLDTGGLGWVVLPLTAPSSFPAPYSLCVLPRPESLRAGTYRGTLTLATITGQAASVAIPITMTVEELPPPKVVVSPLDIQIAVGKNAPAMRRGITVANTGGGTVGFTASAPSPGWLRAENSTGSLAAGRAMAVPFVVDPAGLEPGVYRAKVSVQAGDASQTAQVSLLVSAGAPAVVPTQRGLEFAAYPGGPVPEVQSPSLSNAGPVAAAVRAETSATGGGNWLRIAGAPTEAARGETPLPVAVNPQGLVPGRYTGQVQVTSGTAANTPQTIGVGLTVLAGGPLPVGGTPAFGVTIAGSDNERLRTLNGAPDRSLDFSTVVGTESTRPWLSAGPQSGQIPAGGNVTITVRGTTADLPPGGYRGAVQVGLSDGSIQTAPVLLGSPVSRQGCKEDDAAGVGFLAPAEGFKAVVGQAVTLRAGATGCNGTVLNDAEVGVLAGGRMITLTRESPGIWAGTWVPVAAEDPSTLTAFAAQTTLGSRAAAFSVTNGRVAAAAPGWPPVATAVLNTASSDIGGAVAPMSWVSIYGESLAENTVVADTYPFPPALDGVEVRAGDLALPLYFVSPRQINALLPRALGANTIQTLLVRRRGAASVPVPVSIADAAPGIFTVNQAGTGQAAALIAGTTTVPARGTPARRGEYVQLFCTGLGPVANPPADGAAAPPAPLSPTLLPLKLFLAGRELPVSFSGLAPGNAGLYQVDFRVPDDAPTSDVVPVSMLVKGLSSNTATIAIQ
jgi:uncharacterized protein (TIGR03437 family)